MLVQMYTKAKPTGKKKWYATFLLISDPNPKYAKSPNWEKCQVCAGGVNLFLFESLAGSWTVFPEAPCPRGGESIVSVTMSELDQVC